MISFFISFNPRLSPILRWLLKMKIMALALKSARLHQYYGVVVPLLLLLLTGNSASENSRPSFGNDRYWVFLADKGPVIRTTGEMNVIAQKKLSARALDRRGKMGIAIDNYDLPIYNGYIENVRKLGAEIYRVSKWLNAVSVTADPSQLQMIANLPCVRDIKPVATLRRPPDAILTQQTNRNYLADSSYGLSFDQLFQIGIIQLHRLGFTGEGILIAIFDTGFYLDHQAFDSLMTNNRLVAAFDFINNDQDVQDGDDFQRIHGTSAFSCLSAYLPGTIVGGAYGADFALAKTEIVQNEIRIEEDNWVAAAEWSDSLGAHIISSSLGYTQWYSYGDMDGNTAVTTIAADIAASRGILVVNASGNEGNGSWRYIISPADGDSVLAVGAVDSLGIRKDFSSMGPTSDGRIKPDIMALGLDVFCATSQTEHSYGYLTGTSFATPLAASAAALILQASQGNLTPGNIIDTIHSYSSLAQSPDTLYGWGIIDAIKASGAFRIIAPRHPVFTGGEEFTVTLKLRGPDGPHSGDSLELTIFPEESIIIEANFIEEAAGNYTALLSTTQDRGMHRLVIRDVTQDIADSVLINVLQPPVDYSSYFRNYPNPFKTGTDFSFYLPAPAQTRISIYTVSGESIRQILIPAVSTHQGINNCRWDGDNDNGNDIAAGVYICVIRTPLYDGVTKAVLIR